MSRLLAVLFIAIMSFSGISFALGDSIDRDTGEVLKEGDILPLFSLSMLEDDVMNSCEGKEKPFVMVFFNTNCSDCKNELPVIQKFYAHHSHDLQLVCVSRDFKGEYQSEEEIIHYWKLHHFTMPFVVQTDRNLYNQFARFGIPRIYIADSEYIIRKTFVTKVSYRQLCKALKSINRKNN